MDFFALSFFCNLKNVCREAYLLIRGHIIIIVTGVKSVAAGLKAKRH